ncbi:MAG: hypothetical protein ABIA47_01675 [bacterium]
MNRLFLILAALLFSCGNSSTENAPAPAYEREPCSYRLWALKSALETIDASIELAEQAPAGELAEETLIGALNRRRAMREAQYRVLSGATMCGMDQTANLYVLAACRAEYYNAFDMAFELLDTTPEVIEFYKEFSSRGNACEAALEMGLFGPDEDAKPDCEDPPLNKEI